jgi:hypothetical protein
MFILFLTNTLTTSPNALSTIKQISALPQVAYFVFDMISFPFDEDLFFVSQILGQFYSTQNILFPSPKTPQ